jgi:hypothetical protein
MAVARPTDFKDPDYTAVFAERTGRIKKLREDRAWHLLKRYYADGNYVDFIEDWLVTYDPRNSARNKPTTVPFMLFPKQAQFITWLQDRKDGLEDGLCEKSRDMGISWCTLAFALCEWMFCPGSKNSFGSRKESLVDSIGDPDSLFEKIRLMLRFLPEELRPFGYDEAKHARFMKITNPENGAIITGEAGDNIGRGGRSTMYFVDEAAFLERPEKVDAALSQNTACRIDVSTPNGKDNPFALKRHAGEVPVFTFHWRQDPRKDQAWYDKEVKRINDSRVVAQELDLDYEASGEETIIQAEWVRSSRALRAYLRREGLLPKVIVSEGVSGYDVGGGRSENCYIPRWGPIVGEVTAWKEEDTINQANRVQELALQDGIPVVKYDAPGVGKGVAAAFRRLTKVTAQGINTGEGATKTVWPDGKKAKDKFLNLKAELWWTARERLKKTHQHWLWIQGLGGEEHDVNDMLFLPQDRELGVQLCILGWNYMASGKIQAETKAQLKTRGVASPDRADTFILSLAPDPPRMRTGKTAGVI